MKDHAGTIWFLALLVFTGLLGAYVQHELNIAEARCRASHGVFYCYDCHCICLAKGTVLP